VGGGVCAYPEVCMVICTLNHCGNEHLDGFFGAM
jgi:hypothetical protein